jgi:hypothetical protein
VFIPNLPGEYTIPPVRLVYFDPKAGSYAIASSKEMQISVAAGEGASASVAGIGAPGEILAKDIRYIKTQVPSFSRAGDRLYTRKGFLLLQLLAPAMIIGAYVLRTVRDRAGANPVRSRERGARREAQNGLAAARSLAREASFESAWKALGATLRGYIADITNTSAQGLTTDETASSLNHLGIPGETIDGVLSLLDSCDVVAFAPRGESASNPDEAIRKAAGTVDDLERGRANK